VAVKESQDRVIFLRKISPGPSDRSYGLQVARLAGLPPEVIKRAREILFNLEKLELDEQGKPRLAYHQINNYQPAQLWLFSEDRELAALKEIKQKLLQLDPNQLTPLQALELIAKLKEELTGSSLAYKSSDSSSKSRPSSSKSS